MPKFGKQMNSIKELKKNLKKGSSKGFINFIPKNGSITVRFLEEPERWVNYIEVYDQTIRKGYPLPDDETMPGFDPDLRRSSRYVANALDINNDRVIALQMPKDLVNQLVRYYEKYDTITDRDYELMRDGEGFDTTYAAAPEEKVKRQVAKYDLKDLEEVLEAAYNDVWGEGDDDDEDDEPKPARKRASKAAASKRKAKFEEDEDDDIDDDDDDDEDLDDDVDADDDEDDEEDLDADDDDEDEDEGEADDDDEDEDEDEDDVWDEASLGALGIAELRRVARDDFGISTKGKAKQALIDEILGGETF